MSLKHLATGSICPPLGKGILRVYSMKYCPFAERTLLVLKAKKVEHEIVNVNLKKKPEWLHQKSPLLKVPALEFGDKIIYESAHTCDFLDEAYPHPPLHPLDRWRRFSEKSLVNYFEHKVVSPMVRLMFRFKDPEKASEHLEQLKKGWRDLESELAKKGTKFYGGDTPTMVDYMIWPWFERIPVMESALGDRLFTDEECPNLVSYLKLMMKNKVVKAVMLSKEEHLEYLHSVISGKFQYDFEEAAKL